MATSPKFDEYFSQAVPAVVVQGTVEDPRGEGSLRAGGVTVVGADAHFWSLGKGGPEHPPGRGEIVLNAPLAAEIDARTGDEVLLRIGSTSQIPPDSALGRKTETIRNRRLRVSEVIAAEGLGRFAYTRASGCRTMLSSRPRRCKKRWNSPARSMRSLSPDARDWRRRWPRTTRLPPHCIRRLPTTAWKSNCTNSDMRR